MRKPHMAQLHNVTIHLVVPKAYPGSALVDQSHLRPVFIGSGQFGLFLPKCFYSKSLGAESLL